MKKKKNKKSNMNCKKCKGQQMCCSQPMVLTVAEIKRLFSKEDVPKIWENDELINVNAEHAICPFLNRNNKCSIYKERPNACRIFNCCDSSQMQVFGTGEIADQLKKIAKTLTPKMWLYEERYSRLRNDKPIYPCGFPFFEKEENEE